MVKSKSSKKKPAVAAEGAVEITSGFTMSENFIMEHIDSSKAKQVTKKTDKVKKTAAKKEMTSDGEENVDDEEEALVVKKSKKKIGTMFKVKESAGDGKEGFEEQVEETPVVKKSKKKSENVGQEEDQPDLTGFSAPKPVKAAKRKMTDAGEGPEAKKPDWKEIKEQKKTLREDRRKKDSGSLYDLSVRGKRIWEELRREDCPKEKQLTLGAELYKLTKGHAQQLVFAHDTARVIECLFGTGTAAIKEAVFNELKSQTIKLAKSQYAHFYLLKVLRSGTREHRNHIIESLSGHVVELMKHKIAAKVVETAYNDWANAAQRALLAQEFYGPEFKVFKDEGVTTLNQALEKHPAKRDAFLKHMNQSIEPIIAKGVFNHSLLHRLLSEYLTHCADAERSEMVQMLREAAVQVLHTRDGARVAMLCLWHGTPKDRKEIVKSFKGRVDKICQEEYGHMVLMALFDCVDDTKFVYKVILSEMATQLKEIVFHEHGRKVVLYLLAGRDPKYTHPQVTTILMQGDGNAHSKKDAPLRRQELLQLASPALLDAVTADAEAWLKDSSRCLVLAPLLKFGAQGDALLAAFDAVARVVAGPLDQDTRNMFSSQEEKVQHWAEQSAVHMVLKKLIQFDKQRPAGPYFSEALLKRLDKEVLMGWLGCNRGAFLLVTMHETEVPTVQAAVAEHVRPVRKFLQKQTNKGADILDSKLSSSFVE